MVNSQNDCTENDGICKNYRFINNFPDCYYHMDDRFYDIVADDRSYDIIETDDGPFDETDHESMIMRALENGEGDKLGY